MKLIPYLNFHGNCAEALALYAKVLDGKIVNASKWGDSPMAKDVSADYQDKIINARVDLASGESFMASDAPPGRFEVTRGMQLTLDVQSAEEAERIWAALSEGGTIAMPLGETFWAERFGMCTDRFGTPWMVNFDGKMAQG